MIGADKPSVLGGMLTHPKHQRADTDEKREARLNGWAHHYWHESDGLYGWPPWEWKPIAYFRQCSYRKRQATRHRRTQNEH